MRILMDLHTHTVASGHAYSTIMENAKAAAEKGLEGIAMTDHGPAMPGGAHLYHFWNLTALPQQIAGVRVLRGVEANIIDSRGGLDVPADILDRLDIVLAGLHGGCIRSGTTADNTRAMLAAMANPWVDIIVHPGNDEFLINPEAVVEVAVRYGCALEVNNASLSYIRQGSKPFCKRLVSLAKEGGVPLVVGTDSHFAASVGEFAGALELLHSCGVPEEQVLNTSWGRLEQHLARRRDARRKVRQELTDGFEG